jgi:hypothetical protein
MTHLHEWDQLQQSLSVPEKISLDLLDESTQISFSSQPYALELVKNMVKSINGDD